MVASVIGALRVNLGLDSAQFSRGLSQSSSKLTRFAAAAGKIAAGMVASFGTAMTAMGVGAVQAGAEIDRLSQVANTLPEQFQRWSAGAKSVGIEQEKLGDILKDVNDRVGDFVQTGGGPMADFFEKIAPKIGVTAQQFRNLSGADAMQLYVSSLEKANVNQQDFTFYMEAMASDSTLLLPLLKNGGRLMQEYGDRAGKMGAILSGPMLASLREGKSAISDMRLAVDGMKNTIGAQAVPVIKMLAAAVTSAAMFFHRHADAISSGMRTLAGIAIVVATAFATRYAVAVGVTAVRAMTAAVAQSVALEMALGAQSLAAARAAVAAKSLSRGFILLRGALISTGIGALVVAAGYLVGKFLDLVDAAGGVGEAFGLLKDIAVEVFDRIGIAFDMVPAAVSGGVQKMKSVFFAALHDMLSNFAWFVSQIASGMNTIFGTTLSTAEPFQEAIAGLSAASSEASDAAGAAGETLSASWNAASAPLTSLAALNKTVSESATEAASALGSDTGVAGAADKAGEAGKNAAAKLTPLQDVMKRLREENEKLKGTFGMSETEVAVWENLREAQVSATSATGQQIAALTRQNATLDEANQRTLDWRNSMKDVFTQVSTGAMSVKDALANIVAKLVEMRAAAAWDNAFSNFGGGGSLFASMGNFFRGGGDALAGALRGAGLPAIPGFANGVKNFSGGWAQINERSGEIVKLPGGSDVVPGGLSKIVAQKAGGALRPELQASQLTLTDDGRILATIKASIRQESQRTLSKTPEYVRRNEKMAY
ncbi:hypothetical protein [Paracoccus aestuariivivens]|uniref:Phage tail tape measure protein n=1 Tax=Paracoccus aestuariivivens TaxID=1820333 RepID=A0A6L6J8H8_9RHOB|nr:hypothetical protein [Paracoccus aestuariivivens]MTH76311.1 hypothetical protein [Paracoccus aestuariivivens]